MRIMSSSSVLCRCAALLLLLSCQLAHAQISVHDSRGVQSLAQIPTRAAVLDWNLLEQVIELGVTPVAATDTSSYQDWVVKPAIPAATVDVGTRSEPNLEQLAAQQPDVIIISQTQEDLLPRLQQIAPVLVYRNFSAQDHQAQVAITHFRQLAQVFGKSAQAEQKLQAMDARFKVLKQSLLQAFHGHLPHVVVMRFANTTSTFIYTQNSMAAYVLKQLGLTAAISLPPAQWGITQKPLTTLHTLTHAYVLYILPFNQEKKLQHSILWRAMPFVRNQHIHSVDSVWSYGGAISLQYTAEAITKALLAVAPQS